MLFENLELESKESLSCKKSSDLNILISIDESVFIFWSIEIVGQTLSQISGEILLKKPEIHIKIMILVIEATLFLDFSQKWFNILTKLSERWIDWERPKIVWYFLNLLIWSNILRLILLLQSLVMNFEVWNLLF